jgi:hypothetical protein
MALDITGARLRAQRLSASGFAKSEDVVRWMGPCRLRSTATHARPTAYVALRDTGRHSVVLALTAPDVSAAMASYKRGSNSIGSVHILARIEFAAMS